MAAFPSFLLLVFATLTAALWARPPVWRIAAAGAASAAAGLTLLRVHAALPITSQISVWQPASLFGEGLLLTMDREVWPAAFVISVLPLLCLLSRVGAKPTGGPETTAALAMAGFGLAALFASNLLTLMVVWSLMGACRVGWAVLVGTSEEGPAVLVRVVAQEIAAPLLLMLAGFLDQMAGGGASLLAPMRSQLAAVVFLVALLVRAAPISGLAGENSSSPDRSTVGSLAFQVLPASVALASLGRVISLGLSPGAYLWGAWLGLLAVLSGLPGWLGNAASNERGVQLPWCLTGTGVLAACLARSTGAAMAASTLVLVLGGLHALQQVQRPWQRVWPAVGFLTAAGAPALPGAGVVMQLEPLMRIGAGAWILVAVAMAGVAAGLWLRAAQLPSETEVPAGAVVAGTDFAGLGLLLSAALVSLQQGWVGNPLSFGLTAGIAGLGVAVIVLGPLLPQWEIQRSVTPLSRSLAGWVAGLAQAGLAAAGQLVGGVAGLFEGRAGMLWMFLVVLAALLALRA